MTRVKVVTIRAQGAQHLDGCYDQAILQSLHDKWMASFDRTWHNRHYIILTEQPQSLGWHSKLQYKLRGEVLPTHAHHGRLDQAAEQIFDILHLYRPEYVRHQDVGQSDLLSLWASVINGTPTSMESAGRHHLSDIMAQSTVSFDPSTRLITWDNVASRQVGTILTISRWGEQSSASMIKQILSLPGRLTLLHHLKGWSQLRAQAHLADQLAQRQILSALMPNVKALEEFEAAQHLIAVGEAMLLSHQCSILIQAFCISELETLIRLAQQIFKSYGYIVVRESGCLEAVWRSAFPGFMAGADFREEMMVRPSHLMTHNVAHLLSFASDAQGLGSCDWGQGAVRLFKTGSGSTYQLQLHATDDKEALANSLVIAPAGSGKTTLFQHRSRAA